MTNNIDPEKVVLTDIITHDDEEEHAELKRIATLLSNAVSRVPQPEDGSAALADIWTHDPRLDPTGTSFQLELWAKTLLKTLESRGMARPRSGFTFKNLSVRGSGSSLTEFQETVGLLPTIPIRKLIRLRRKEQSEKRILNDFSGTLPAGEMLIVLGRPGSGSSSFLKAMSGELKGLKLSAESIVHYNGIPQSTYIKQLRGDVLYNAENESHFPNLTVGQTIRFAAAARSAPEGFLDLSRDELATYIADIAMSVFELRHVRDTKVGNDFIRGVSGGERKRVSIAEMAASRAPIVAWDNSTKGLDAATALNFVHSLKVSANVWGTTHALAIYQASQSIYDLFDKTMLLYEGRQVYYGASSGARAYFERLGFRCLERQTTPDFLTAVTNPMERMVRPGFESKVPRTAKDFESCWHASSEYEKCLQDIAIAEKIAPIGGAALNELQAFHNRNQMRFTRDASPYRTRFPQQVRLCMIRAFQLMWQDQTPIWARIITQFVLALIIGSVFYGTPETTDGFYAKGSILFMSVLINAFMCVTEIGALFSQRPIVQKHFSFAFYHPFAEALASMLADLPVKLICLTVFSVILYCLGGLRYEAGPFFVYFLFSLAAVLTMSAIFRTIAAAAKVLAQAMMIAGVMILAIAMYTGFSLRRTYMHPWFKWISYINPVSYAFESLLVNEVHGRSFPCADLSLVPPYGTGENFQCAVPGAVAGRAEISGDVWVDATYSYSYSHLWRNFGILIALSVVFHILYLVLSELNSQAPSTGERLIFKRHRGSAKAQQSPNDDESQRSTESDALYRPSSITEVVSDKQPSPQVAPGDIFSWRDVTFDIPVKGGERRLLDHVSGWVKPGTLTALMGVSGAGKTTLLDVLARRVSIGVITGEMLVNGQPLGPSFRRRTGYAQQQDLHLETTTVREALRFSAVLRQPKSTPIEEKYTWVEEVIDLLDMSEFSEAIVGQPGEGLNVEQRKRLTIAVELAAKPSLLLFLDEPTSGLDSTSSWSIVCTMRKIADAGQAVLSTIHQPSTMLFQKFDSLLFLAKGGRTVYCGDLGQDSLLLLSYFENNGARPCREAENPAEYILELVGSKSTTETEIDWPAVWNDSQEKTDMLAELDQIQTAGHSSPTESQAIASSYALPLTSQIQHVTKRAFTQYWRTPRYVMGKSMLATMSALFVGFSFYNQDNSQAGMQGSIFAIFMVTTVFTPLVQQIMPQFLAQRTLYEVRERPSDCYSWFAFMVSNFAVEIFYQLLAGILVYVAWYFAVFGAGQPSLTQGLMLVFCLQFYLFVASFAFMVIAALPDVTTAANVATLLFSMMLIFNGTLQIPDDLPSFWKFMWRTSPLTYLMGAWASTGLSGRQIVCAFEELAQFDPPPGMTCADYLKPYFQQGAPGQLYNPLATMDCHYCPVSNADQYLARSEIYNSDTYRNIGLIFVYIGFNMAAAVALYYLFRVRKVSLLGSVRQSRLVQSVTRRFHKY